MDALPLFGLTNFSNIMATDEPLCPLGAFTHKIERLLFETPSTLCPLAVKLISPDSTTYLVYSQNVMVDEGWV